MPFVDQQELSKRLSARRLERVHLFYGEDVKQIDRLLDAIEATVDPADRPFAVERLFAGENGGYPVDIAAAARSLPMLGDRRIVIVLRAERFLKPKRAAKPADGADDDAEERAEDEPVDFSALEEYFARPSDRGTIVFVATDVDRGRRFTKRLLEVAMTTEFSHAAASVSGGRAPGPGPAWLREELERDGRQIEPAALQMLLQRGGQDITKLRSDVERLLLFTQGQPRITARDVAEIVSEGDAVEDPWALVNAIGMGDAKGALRELVRRLDSGDSPFAVLGQLRWWVSAKLVERDAGRVRPAVDALWRTDLALKSSGGDERVLMERLVVELSGK